MSPSLRQWNARQMRVLQRYCTIHHLPLTPDVVTRFASRYAAKHASWRRAAA